MKMNKTLLLALILFSSLTNKLLAQTINIDFIEFVGRNVVVHYTLDDGEKANRQFLVQLYSSQDNFTTPLTRVSGDFGTEVTAGFDKKIVWDITKELGSYEGTLSLELRGRVYVPFVKLNLKENQVFKRGKNYPLNWTSGNLSGLVNIELYNGAGERIWGENNVQNVGKFDWFIPASVRKGNQYTLKFTNAKDRNDAVFSKLISIRPRIPLLAKIGAGALIGVAATFVSGSGEAPTNEATPYPTPISPN